MNAMSMESIFLVLSGAVLAAGILYWFWSHIQLTQKKVQLLENAVFELRGMQGPGPGPGPKPSDDVRNVPVYRDVDDGDWDQDQGQDQRDGEGQADLRQNDEQEQPPTMGAIHRCRLHDRARDHLQRGKQQQHHEGRALPDTLHRDSPQRGSDVPKERKVILEHPDPDQ